MNFFNIDILIINHNHGKYLTNCLTSIIKTSPKIKKKVFLVINNKHDQEFLQIANKFSKKLNLKVIINKKQKGLSANINQVIKLNTSAKYFLILNPDVILKADTIEKLIIFMEKKPKAGICGPKLIYPSGELQYSARRFPTWKTFIFRRTPLKIFLKNTQEIKKHLYYDLDFSKPSRVDWLLGACWLLRKKVMKDIGLFDERYYLYCEDIDYCFRAWQRGWEVWYAPNALAIHYHLAISDKRFFSIYNWYHFKSMFYFFKKCFEDN